MKTAVITGSTGAIGQAIARQMAEKKYRVIMVCRNREKAETTIQDIVNRTANREVSYLLADLSDEAAIAGLSSSIAGPVDVLINNAATTPKIREVTKEGLEMQFAVNVLGYLRMTFALLPFLKKAERSRVVNVASSWAGNLDLDDLQFTTRRYNNNTAYMQSKQANRMLTVALAKRLEPFGITANAAHPGEVNSRLSNDLGFGGHESPDWGAETPVWLATSADVADITGGWFVYFRKAVCQFASDSRTIERLYETCLQHVKLLPPL